GLTPWEPRRIGIGSGSSSSEKSKVGTTSSGARDREREKDAELLRLANGILFPDRFDGVLKNGGAGGQAEAVAATKTD
ncbi:hypothetical protein EKO27_g11819, partial [Xylaria grammica]